MKAVIKYLPWFERLNLGMMVLSVIFWQLFDSSWLSVFGAALVGLAIIYFLLAFAPMEIERDDESKGGFVDLFALTIAPKTLMIASAISLFGIHMFVFNPVNRGYLQMILISAPVATISLLVLIYYCIQHQSYRKAFLPLIYRGLPIAVVSWYIYYIGINN